MNLTSVESKGGAIECTHATEVLGSANDREDLFVHNAP